MDTKKITPVHYKILDDAFDETLLGHLCAAKTLLSHGTTVEVQPATDLDETRSALLDLIRADLVALSGREAHIPEADAPRIAIDDNSWREPLCWQLDVVLTAAGEAVLHQLDQQREGLQ